jgi:bis(5'-nucleosyl)-tetraphosphatase (symmetrical)
MVHAGVLPQWTWRHAGAGGRGRIGAARPALGEFLRTMYGNEPAQWRDTLTGNARLRAIVNALTRLRFCTATA